MFATNLINPTKFADLVAALQSNLNLATTQNQEMINWVLELKQYIDAGDYRLAQELLITRADLLASNLRITALEGRDAAQQVQIDALRVSKSVVLPFPATKGANIKIADMFAQALVANNKTAQPETPFTIVLTGGDEGEMNVETTTVIGSDAQGKPIFQIVGASSGEMFIINTNAQGGILNSQYLPNFVQELYEWALALFQYFNQIETIRTEHDALEIVAKQARIDAIKAARAQSLAKVNGKYQNPFLVLFPNA
jgi:hypothetical protein